MIRPLTLPDFDIDGVSYGFFGRRGGVGEGLYGSLNCRNGSDDDPAHVAENRARVSAFFGGADVPLNNAYQIHSAQVVALECDLKGARPEADGLVSDQPGLLIGVLTADCTPVLFRGAKEDGAPVIGAAHAGWKGALGGVLENTVSMMIAQGAVPGSIHAAIGPCIAPESYEVSAAFRATFMEEREENEAFFVPSKREGHAMFDLPSYCAMRLRGAGVEHVHESRVDTYANEDGYFSYRRSTHRSEPDYGGQISAIMIGK